MRKVLAILLISLLSLQASWAAAAGYCRHEQGAAARHFGHHEHQHLQKHAGYLADASQSGHSSDSAVSADSLSATIAGADLDCSVCQATALIGVPSAPVLSASDAPVLSAAVLIQHQPPAVPQPRPERPNWFAA